MYAMSNDDQIQRIQINPELVVNRQQKPTGSISKKSNARQGRHQKEQLAIHLVFSM
jgi:hypothetical protein